MVDLVVIVPNYNNVRFLMKCLTSPIVGLHRARQFEKELGIPQTLPDDFSISLVIGDDCSTDGKSAEYIKFDTKQFSKWDNSLGRPSSLGGYEEIKTYFAPENVGKNELLNRLIPLAAETGAKTAVILDADDQLTTPFFSFAMPVFNYLTNHPDGSRAALLNTCDRLEQVAPNVPMSEDLKAFVDEVRNSPPTKYQNVSFLYTPNVLVDEHGEILGYGKPTHFDSELLKTKSFMPQTGPILMECLLNAMPFRDPGRDPVTGKRLPGTKHIMWNQIFNECPGNEKGKYEAVYIPQAHTLAYTMSDENLSGIGIEVKRKVSTGEETNRTERLYSGNYGQTQEASGSSEVREGYHAVHPSKRQKAQGPTQFELSKYWKAVTENPST